MFLAMDTATDYGSVAVGRPGALAAEVVFAKRRHASDLMPAIVEALEIAGTKLLDVTGIVVADGPGSFTGLRIGVATALGIKRERSDIDLYTAPSLLCSAYGARLLGDGPVVSMYDALRGEVFAALYSFEQGAVRCFLPPTLGKIVDLRQECEVGPIVAVGDGAILHPKEIQDWTGTGPVGPPDFVPRASYLLDLVGMDGAARKIEKPTTFEPEYGRLAEAQVKLEQALGDAAGGKTG